MGHQFVVVFTHVRSLMTSVLLTTYLPDHTSSILKILVLCAELALSETLSMVISLFSLHVIVLFLSHFQQFLLAHLFDCFSEWFGDVM